MVQGSKFYGKWEANPNHKVGRKCLSTILPFKVWPSLASAFWENWDSNYGIWSNGEKTQHKNLLNCHVQPPFVIDASPRPIVRANSIEENAPEETIANDFEGQNENNYSLKSNKEF